LTYLTLQCDLQSAPGISIRIKNPHTMIYFPPIALCKSFCKNCRQRAISLRLRKGLNVVLLFSHRRIKFVITCQLLSLPLLIFPFSISLEPIPLPYKLLISDTESTEMLNYRVCLPVYNRPFSILIGLCILLRVLQSIS
jgi:hypothetical protein